MEQSRLDSLPEDDLSVMISRLKASIRNGSIIYPAIGEFVEFDYKVIRRKYNQYGRMLADKLTEINPMVSELPMHAPRSDQCGTIFWHGTDKITLDYDGQGQGTYSRVQYQARSCHSPECEVCGDKAMLDKAWELAQRIEASQTYIRQYMGETPRTLEIVFSPPQATKEQLARTLHYAQSLEGFQEFQYQIEEAIRQATGDKDGMTWGAVIFYHAFRQNGRDGQKNGWNGNDGIPDHWRFAPHFHVVLTTIRYPGELVKAFNDLRGTDLLKGWVVKVGPNQKEEAEARAEGVPFVPHVLYDHTDLENKLDYILSHTAIRHKADSEGQATGRRLPMFSVHGLNHHSRISRIEFKKGVPLLNQGYSDFIEDSEGQRKGMYWAKVLYMCLDNNVDIELARVERINSGHVYIPRIYRDECRASVSDFIKDNPRDLEGLYRLIRTDQRYITNFIPKEGCPMRYPNRLKTIDGGDLKWTVSGLSESDLYAVSDEYLKFCQEADKRDDELRAMGVRIWG